MSGYFTLIETHPLGKLYKVLFEYDFLLWNIGCIHNFSIKNTPPCSNACCLPPL